jgi:hypothetical protein
MFGRIAATAALIALAGCAGMESAGRNASRAPEPTRVASTPPPAARPAPAPPVTLPPPAATTTAPAAAAPPPPTATAPRAVAVAPPPAQTTPPPRVVASAPAAPPPATRTVTPPPAPVAEEEEIQTASLSDDDVVVPGVRERQVQAPNGDPRSNAERMQDIRAWDRCVMSVQGAAEADPLRPQLVTPEDYCSQSLGMAERTSVPQSRLERRRN